MITGQRFPQNMSDAVATPEADADSLVRRALALHQQGELAAAATLCESALRSHPRHFPACHLRGVIAWQCDELPRAVHWLTQAVAMNPRSAAAHTNLGNAQLQSRLLEAALLSYETALAIDPQLVSALYNRGNALRELQRGEEAIASYDRAIALNPDQPGAHNNRGLALAAIGQPRAALASYERALALAPRAARVWSNRGNALHDLGEHQAALESFDKAIGLDPRDAHSYGNRARILARLRRYDAALASCDAALALNPGFAEAHMTRGIALRGLQQFSAALLSFERAIALKADYAEAHNNRGAALRDLGMLSEAIASYDRAIAVKPDYAEAYSNRGIALGDRHELCAAIASFDRAIELRPELADAHFYRAITHLQAGDFAQGWPGYEWRWKTSNSAAHLREFPQPLWLGREPLAGRTVLLHGEQGLGDMLQFCRYATLVADLGADVLLEVPQPLTELLSGVAGVRRVVARGEPLPEFHYHCPLMSLPLAFNTTLETIPSQQSYLKSDPAKNRIWRTRLGAQRKLRVGLTWSGGIQADDPDYSAHSTRRNIPLAMLAPLRHENIDFYSLQRGGAAESELTELTARQWAGPPVIDFVRLLHDFSDTAALVENLDLVITVETAVAHLSGALGRPVWIMCSFDTCWRWLLDRSDSPWYPTARLFRQERPGDWAPVVARIREDLFRLATGGVD